MVRSKDRSLGRRRAGTKLIQIERFTAVLGRNNPRIEFNNVDLPLEAGPIAVRKLMDLVR